MSYLDHRLEPWCDGEDFSPALVALLAAMMADKEKNGERATDVSEICDAPLEPQTK